MRYKHGIFQSSRKNKITTKNKSFINMDKWAKRGAIVGGIWGFLSWILVFGGTLEPIGYSQYFIKSSATQWVIYFPGMIFTYLDYKRVFGFELGIFNIVPAIFVGVIIGYGIGILIRKIRDVLKCEKSIP